MELRWHERTFSQLTASELYAVIELRERVFVVEQNCVYLDADGVDRVCRHLWATQGAAADADIVAYCRLVPAGTKCKEVSIGRVITAPAARGTGLGKELMRRAITACGAEAIRIEAQAYLQRFYVELGFVAEGEIFDLDGIPHIEMVRS